METTPKANFTPGQGTSTKAKLTDVLDDINLKTLAEKGFGRSSGWLYHKLNGAIVNGKPDDFKPEEVEQLRKALNELGHRLIIASNRL